MSPENMQSPSGVYRCSSRSYGPRPIPCGMPSVRAADLEAWAWDLAMRFIRGERLESINGQLAAVPDIREQRLADLHARSRDITSQQARLLSDYRRSQSIPWSLVEGEIQQAESERELLMLRIAELSLDLQTDRDAGIERQRLQSWQESVADRLEMMTFDERRQALEAIGARVTVHGKTSDQWEYEDDL